MFIVGHCLVWHSQVPAWVFQDDKGAPLDRDGLLKRMRDHISTVVGRYKGRINGWDVVNEALNEDGTLRQTPWLKIIGEDYLAKAFQFAHEADPQAELYYNDYSLEGNVAKRKGAVEIVIELGRKPRRVGPAAGVISRLGALGGIRHARVPAAVAGAGLVAGGRDHTAVTRRCRSAAQCRTLAPTGTGLEKDGLDGFSARRDAGG